MKKIRTEPLPQRLCATAGDRFFSYLRKSARFVVIFLFFTYEVCSQEREEKAKSF